MNEPAYLSVRSASLLLDGIGESVIRQAIAADAFPVARLGRADSKRKTIRIKRDDLLAWVESLTKREEASA